MTNFKMFSDPGRLEMKAQRWSDVEWHVGTRQQQLCYCVNKYLYILYRYSACYRYDFWSISLSPMLRWTCLGNKVSFLLETSSSSSVNISAVKRLKYLIAINRINVIVKGCISGSRPKHKLLHSSDLSSQSASCPPHKPAAKKTRLCTQPVLRDRTQ